MDDGHESLAARIDDAEARANQAAATRESALPDPYGDWADYVYDFLKAKSEGFE